MKRDQFTFYRSYYEAIKTLPAKELKTALIAICAYALDEEAPSLSGIANSVFALVRPTLDTRKRRIALTNQNEAAKTKNKAKTNRNEQEQMRTNRNKPARRKRGRERER